MFLCDYLSVCLCVFTWQKFDQAGGPETFLTHATEVQPVMDPFNNFTYCILLGQIKGFNHSITTILFEV